MEQTLSHFSLGLVAWDLGNVCASTDPLDQAVWRGIANRRGTWASIVMPDSLLRQCGFTEWRTVVLWKSGISLVVGGTIPGIGRYALRFNQSLDEAPTGAHTFVHHHSSNISHPGDIPGLPCGPEDKQ